MDYTMTRSEQVASTMESDGEKFKRKMRDAPFLPAGVGAFVGVLAYGAYKFKHRGNMSASLYLVQLRVASQSMVVGALCLSIAYTLGKRIYNRGFGSESPKEH